MNQEVCDVWSVSTASCSHHHKIHYLYKYYYNNNKTMCEREREIAKVRLAEKWALIRLMATSFRFADSNGIQL